MSRRVASFDLRPPLAKICALLWPAVSGDETRPHLALGVWVDGTCAWATDGHRLHVVRLSEPMARGWYGRNGERLESNLAQDTKPPPYANLVPAPFGDAVAPDRHLTLDTFEVSELARWWCFSAQMVPTLDLETGTLTLARIISDVERKRRARHNYPSSAMALLGYAARVDRLLTFAAESGAPAVNLRYLADALDFVCGKGQVGFTASDPLAPLVISGADRCAIIIMPVRK